MGAFSDGALPFGLIFFGVMVLGFFRRKAGNVVARGQYPGLAKKLGLSHRPSPYKNGVGRIEGELQGFFVSVDPDDQRRIYLRFAHAPPVDLRSYVHTKRPAPGMVSFRPLDPIVGAQFKTTHASKEMIQRLDDASDLPKTLRPLKFLRQLKSLTVSPQGVTAGFDYGNPPYIPAEVVDDVLPRLIHLARVFESVDDSGPGDSVPSSEDTEPEQSE
jgi:hypothetical protein